MIDENAFGIALGYSGLEDDEYALEREEFLSRWAEFRACVLECLHELPPGRGVRALDLGHLIYAELADGDQSEDPVHWLRAVRARLAARGFETMGVVTYGGRWVPEAAETALPDLSEGPEVQVWSVSYPSEPLRRALWAETAGRRDEDCPQGWGPGLYVDSDALEPLGKKLKNAPTALHAAGATYYRFGS